MTNISIEENAVEFVNLLTPGNFQKAQLWLGPHCEYRYQDQTLTGEAIIKSFSDNHDNADSKLEISYVDGFVKKVEGSKVFVGVQDKISVGGESHLYEDCLAITCNENRGEGSIEKIEHCPIPEERQKLKEFLNQVGVEL